MSDKNNNFTELIKITEILDWRYIIESKSLYISYKIAGAHNQIELNTKQLEKYMKTCGLCKKIDNGIIHLDNTKNGLAAYFKYDFTNHDCQHLIASIEANKNMNKAMNDTFWAANSAMHNKLQTILNK